MKVIICGAGVVGYNIAKQLAGEGIDVTVIDQSAELIKRISDNLDVQAMVGFASHPDVLGRAGCADADMIIAVTFADEVNMMACQVAHSLFKTPTKIARVRAQPYLAPQYTNLFSRDHLPIDVIISPEKEVARAVAQRLEVPGATNIKPFANDKLRMVSVILKEGAALTSTQVGQVYDLFPSLDMRIVGVYRNNRMIAPTNEDQLFTGDEVFFIVRAEHMTRAMAAFGHEEEEARRAVIIGGGNVGAYLAELLESTEVNIKTKIIEYNRERAEVISELLPNTTVLHGSALDRDVLHEASITTAEAVVAVTNDDEVNVLSTLLSKREGARRAFAIVNNTSYDLLVTNIGVDVVINPRTITVSRILRYVRRGLIEDLHSVKDGSAEVLEAKALETSPLVGKTVAKATLAGTCIGGVLRDDEVLMPTPDLVIQAGDRVVMLALKEAVKKVEKQFAVRVDFF